MKFVVLNLLIHFLWYCQTERMVWAEREETKHPFVSKLVPNSPQTGSSSEHKL